jgi:UDP-N-acetylglucosamine 2-epimerase
LLQRATCVVHGADAALLEESNALDVPALMLLPRTARAPSGGDAAGSVLARNADQAVRAVHEALRTRQNKEEQVEAYWDGGPAMRIAQHLRSMLPKAETSGEAGGVAASVAS